MAEDVIKVRVEADGQQAKAELAGVSQSIDQVGKSAEQAGSASKTFSERAVEVKDLWSAASTALQQGERAIAALTNGLKDVAKQAGLSGDALDDFNRRMDSIPTNPFKAVISGIGEVVGQLREWADADEKVRLAMLARISAEEADKLSIKELNKLVSEHVGQLDERRAAIEKLTDAIRPNSDALKVQAENLVEAARRAQESGALSAEATEVLQQQVQKLLDSFAQSGEVVPAALAAIADKYEVVTTRAEEAAEAQADASEKAEEAAQREIEAAEKAAAKEEERAVREAEAHAKRVAAALDAAIAKEEAAAREVAAAEAGVRAIEDELRQFADADTPEGLAELNAELADLRSQDILTPQQLKRLQDLEDITGSITAKMRDWRVVSEKLAKQDEILTRLEKARAKALELEDERLAAMLETLAIQNREFREAANTTNDFGGAAGDAAMSFEELERANADALDTAGRFGGEADDLAGTLGDLGEAAGDFSKELGDLAKETDKADSGFGKMGEQADELIPKLEEIKRLVSEIKEEAGSISLGL